MLLEALSFYYSFDYNFPFDFGTNLYEIFEWAYAVLKGIKVLQYTTLFNGTDKETMEELLSHFAPTTLPKKTLIYSSQTKTSFYIILKGRVKLSQINPETGREYIIFILEAGDAFDIISLLDGEEHEVIIEVIDDTISLL
ncbi:MAG: hypothetical protein DRJ01_12295 [Bacteroidetes bacterium]|nr:MAG: hypothetical protein DRJ01_12295 [Bacteroidota bacterium]